MQLIPPAIRFLVPAAVSFVGLATGLGAGEAITSALQVAATAVLVLSLVFWIIPEAPEDRERRPSVAENLLSHAATLGLVGITLTFPWIRLIIPLLPADFTLPSWMLLGAVLVIWLDLAVTAVEGRRHRHNISRNPLS